MSDSRSPHLHVRTSNTRRSRATDYPLVRRRSFAPTQDWTGAPAYHRTSLSLCLSRRPSAALRTLRVALSLSPRSTLWTHLDTPYTTAPFASQSLWSGASTCEAPRLLVFPCKIVQHALQPLTALHMHPTGTPACRPTALYHPSRTQIGLRSPHFCPRVVVLLSTSGGLTRTHAHSARQTGGQHRSAHFCRCLRSSSSLPALYTTELQLTPAPICAWAM